MCSLGGLSWTFAIGVVGVLSAVAGEVTPAKKLSTPLPKVYSSPGEVFDAYRKARDKDDWRTLFSCLTKESQELEVFEVFIACETTSHHQEARAVCKKYGVDNVSINTIYYAKYKRKHGIDIAQIVTERENNAKKANESRQKKRAKDQSDGGAAVVAASPSEDLGPPLPPRDEDLIHEVISAQIKDKAGFFEEAHVAIACKPEIDLEPRIGPLEQVTIHGETAIGRAKMTMFHLESTDGKTSNKIGSTSDETFNFQRVNSSWLLTGEK